MVCDKRKVFFSYQITFYSQEETITSQITTKIQIQSGHIQTSSQELGKERKRDESKIFRQI